ncbi:class I SAM-dependent RNA methyltransferase [Frigidibacter sp. MR17.14]|uniref:class I SAM-dependent RNA methyltransferase n=1 Tax=Frigidibacter sp. MR17.14 TaxID=3126509 RepID=UPI0030129E73
MTVTIDRLSLHAEGIARTEAGPLYVPGALPGEVVDGAVEGGRIATPKIVTPSADRVRAPCPHYRACGGCSLQHASDPFVAGWKRQVVEVALAGQGLQAPVLETITSPARSRRRATFAGRRTKTGALVGFHARASDTVVEIPNCLLLDPALIAALPVLREIVLAGGSRKGGLDLTLTVTEGGLDLAVTGGKPMDPALFQSLSAVAETADLARLTWEGETVAGRRPPAQRFGAGLVEPPAGGFLQATRAGEAALVAEVLKITQGADRIADLFAGAGTFTLPLAAGAEVHAVESDAAALAALDRGWRRAPGLKRVSTETRDLFRRPLLPDELNRYDAIVIDPPRAGAEAQSAELAAATVPVIAYVSCNPVTFARDAARLVAAGYTLEQVQVVDQFRWSAHVELVARFRNSRR